MMKSSLLADINMDHSPSTPSIAKRAVKTTLVAGIGTGFATAAALAGASTVAWLQQAPELSLLGNIITGTVVAAGTLAGSVFTAAAIKKGVELVSDEGKMVWEHIAQTTLGKSLVELNSKMGDFKHLAGTAALAAIPAVAFDQIQQAVQHPVLMATIGVGICAPLAVMEGLGEQDKLAKRLEARRNHSTRATHAPRMSIR
jgi:hypothetical protein